MGLPPSLRSPHLLLPPPTRPHLLLPRAPLLQDLPSLPVPSSTRPMEWRAPRRMVGENASGWVLATTVDVLLLPKQISRAAFRSNQDISPPAPNRATLMTSVRHGIA